MRYGRFSAAILGLTLLLLVPASGVGAVPMRQVSQLIAADQTDGDNFGFTVALSGDGTTALVGARGRKNYTGTAFAFTRTNTGWVQTDQLIGRLGNAGDYFGESVSLSADGTTALIGAYSANDRVGAAFIFTLVSAGGRWIQRATLTPPDGMSGDSFGTAVALSADGNTAVVGAPNASNVGAAYVYNRADDTWPVQARVNPPDAQMRDAFGTSVSVNHDGSLLLVSATGRNTNAGTAYIFTHADNGWSQSIQLSAGDGSAGDFFGLSVALSADGSAAIIGAPNRSTFRGTTYVYYRNDSSWVQSLSLSVTDGASNDRFGNSVAINGDGSVVLVGAPNKNKQTGTAYVFQRIGGKDGPYTQQSKLTADDAMTSDHYGTALALSGNGAVALIGASERSSAGGVAYIYA